MCYVYGFDLLESLCLVSMVVALVVPCLFGCVVSTIHTVQHYIPFCMYHLPKWNMVCDHLKSLLAYCVLYHSSRVTFFPLVLAFFNSTVIKSIFEDLQIVMVSPMILYHSLSPIPNTL